MVYFLDQPELDMDFTGLANLVDIPGVKGAVWNAIRTALVDAIVLPNTISIPIATQEQGVNLARLNQALPVGVLRVAPLYGSGALGVGQVNDPCLQISIADQCSEQTWGSNHDFIVYDWDTHIHMHVLDSCMVELADSLGSIAPLSVHEALAMSQAPLPLMESSDDVSAAYFQFDWLHFCSIDQTTQNFMLKVEVHRLFLPAKFGKEAKVSAQITRNGAELRKKDSKIGRETVRKSEAKTVEATLIKVVQRCHEIDMSANDIAHVTGFDAQRVTEILKGRPRLPTGAAPVMRRPMHDEPPQRSSLLSTIGSVFSLLRLCPHRQGQLPAATAEVDLEASPLNSTGAHHEGAKEEPVEEFLTSLEFNVTLFLLADASDVKGSSLLLDVRDNQCQSLANTSIPLRLVRSAENCALPEKLFLAPAGGGAGVEAEVKVSLRGLEVSSA